MIGYVFKQAEKQMYLNKIKEDESRRKTILTSLINLLREKTQETKSHTENLKQLSIKFAKSLNLHLDKINELKLLSKLHDIGKTTIPEKILKKPDNLSPEEFEIVKSHSEKGYRIIKEIPELAPIAELILSHHEAWDGTGYPRGLKKTEIPYNARVFSIIEAYEVMTTKTVYRDSYPPAEALKEIQKEAGHKYDPSLVKKFVEYIKKDEKVQLLKRG